MKHDMFCICPDCDAAQQARIQEWRLKREQNPRCEQCKENPKIRKDIWVCQACFNTMTSDKMIQLIYNSEWDHKGLDLMMLGFDDKSAIYFDECLSLMHTFHGTKSKERKEFTKAELHRLSDLITEKNAAMVIKFENMRPMSELEDLIRNNQSENNEEIT